MGLDPAVLPTLIDSPLQYQMELKPIEGYYADSVDLERDAKRIDDNWIHSASLASTT